MGPAATGPADDPGSRAPPPTSRKPRGTSPCAPVAPGPRHRWHRSCSASSSKHSWRAGHRCRQWARWPSSGHGRDGCRSYPPPAPPAQALAHAGKAHRQRRRRHSRPRHAKPLCQHHRKRRSIPLSGKRLVQHNVPWSLSCLGSMRLINVRPRKLNPESGQLRAITPCPHRR